MSSGDSHDIDHGANERERLTTLPPGARPSRQLRRVGVKIGRKVLEFQRPVVRFGPLHVYVSPAGRVRIQWRPRRR